MQDLIIIDKTGTGYSAYSPHLPGCIVPGGTEEEINRNMRKSIEFHRDGLQEEGYAIPSPTSAAAYGEVARAA